MVAERNLGLAAHFHGEELEQLLDQGQHVVVVSVGPIELHLRKLGIVSPVQTFVAEVLADFEDLLQPADDQPLQVQLVGNPHEHLLFEHVVERLKRPRRGPAVNRLQDWRFDLGKPALGKEPAYEPGHLGSIQQHLS